jgi:O-antigen ligase
MVIWLLNEARSATASLSLVFGTAILLFIRRSVGKTYVRHLGKYALVLICFLLVLYTMTGIFGSAVNQLGRDMTLTGRTDLWADLLSAPVNPIIGAGYKSFWLGSFAASMWHKYSFHPNQAHNGYLETYLQSGAIGVSFLILMIACAVRKLKRRVIDGDTYARLCLAFLILVLFYNWTEAFFQSLHPLWIMVLLASVNYSRNVNHLHTLAHVNGGPGNLAGVALQPRLSAHHQRF